MCDHILICFELDIYSYFKSKKIQNIVSWRNITVTQLQNHKRICKNNSAYVLMHPKFQNIACLMHITVTKLQNHKRKCDKNSAYVSMISRN